MDAALSPAPRTPLLGQAPCHPGSWPRAKPKTSTSEKGAPLYPHLMDKDTEAGKLQDMPEVRQPEVKRTSSL